MDGAIPEAALRPSKVHLKRRWAWRAFVKSAETIYGVLMALQAAALLPSAFAIPKEGKSSVSLKDPSLFGISLSDHVKAESSSSALRFKKESNQRKLAHGAVRAQTETTTTPAVNRAAPEGKKTLRKGSVVITGASSRLGLATAKAPAETGIWHVIMGSCRDFLKAERAAKAVGIAKENYIVMHLDLASLDSVSQFVDNFKRSGRPLDVLVCNAAVYLPTAKKPTCTAEGFELSVGTNHLGHFLLLRLMLDDLKQSNYPSKSLIIVGSIIVIAHGINAADVKKLQDAGIYTCNGLMMHTKKSLGLCTSSHAFYHCGERLIGPTMKLVTTWNSTRTLYSGEHQYCRFWLY